jgi:hypothetical protein
MPRFVTAYLEAQLPACRHFASTDCILPLAAKE